MNKPNLEIRKLQPKDLPAPMGSYSHGVLVPLPGADILFVTGQIALDSQGNVIAANDPKKQAEAVFENIGKILAEAGLNFSHVVKAQVFLTNVKDVPAVSEVRNRYFAESKPAGTWLEVSKLVK
ncbi:MAG TPA: RidA family protein, partial [Candidatus Acidoferrales bacterium]|nr:RidA family protein [Candidatus Acidoferrales bacterium]